MILITFDKNFDKINGIICIYLDNNKYKYNIGRSDSNDIICDDVSVSRNHAILIKK